MTALPYPLHSTSGVETTSILMKLVKAIVTRKSDVDNDKHDSRFISLFRHCIESRITKTDFSHFSNYKIVYSTGRKIAKLRQKVGRGKWLSCGAMELIVITSISIVFVWKEVKIHYDIIIGGSNMESIFNNITTYIVWD